MTYQGAERLYAKARDKGAGKPLGRHTRLEYIGETTDGKTFGIRYHGTYFVLINDNGTFTLNSGGWRTMTTKARINEYSPVYIFQRKGDWFIEEGVHFFDGVKVNAGGAILY